MLRRLLENVVPAPPDSHPALSQPRPDGFLTAHGADALFPATDPAIDGDECLRDCASCSVHLPRTWAVDEQAALYGSANGWSRHLIVATGETDWARAVEDVAGSVMAAVGEHVGTVAGGKLMVSASDMPPPATAGDRDRGPYGADRPTTVLLMPSFTYVDNVTPQLVPQLIDSVVNPAPTNTTPLHPPAPPSPGTASSSPGTASSSPGTASSSPGTASSSPGHVPHAPPDLPAGLSLRPCPHQYIILLCSQATRDVPCGQSAPLLRKELERHLRPLGLLRDRHDERPGGVGIYFVSHVGGHKYSANMLVYRRAEPRTPVPHPHPPPEPAQAAQCIWLARIRPEDCENVVRFTLLQGKVVKPERQLRGGFDRERRVVSW